MNGSPASLAAHQLNVCVPGRTLVSQLNVDCRHGEFLAVLGRNGAGKSLTLHTLAGLRDVSAGTVSFKGRPIGDQSRRNVAQELALLPQDAEDTFPATVFDTVLVGRHPHIKPLRLESSADREFARRCLHEVHLEDLLERDVATLSGGERRRLAIAQTLAQSPQTFLLDEPLNHLDPQHQLDVLRLFAARADDGAAVVATLHDANLAARFATRCLLLFGDGHWELGETRNVLTTETLSRLFGVRMESLRWQDTTQFVAVGDR